MRFPMASASNQIVLTFEDKSCVEIQEADSQGLNDFLFAKAERRFSVSGTNSLATKLHLLDIFQDNEIDATWGWIEPAISLPEPPSEPTPAPLIVPVAETVPKPPAIVQAHPI